MVAYCSLSSWVLKILKMKNSYQRVREIKTIFYWDNCINTQLGIFKWTTWGNFTSMSCEFPVWCPSLGNAYIWYFYILQKSQYCFALILGRPHFASTVFCAEWCPSPPPHPSPPPSVHTIWSRVKITPGRPNPSGSFHPCGHGWLFINSVCR